MRATSWGVRAAPKSRPSFEKAALQASARSCAAVAAALRERRGLPFEVEDVFLTNGAFAALAIVLGAIVDPGEWPRREALQEPPGKAADDGQFRSSRLLLFHRRSQGFQQSLSRLENAPAGCLLRQIQDGSDLDYTSLAQCEDLGVIGTNQTGAQSRGLHLHSTLAVAPNDVRAKATRKVQVK